MKKVLIFILLVLIAAIVLIAASLPTLLMVPNGWQIIYAMVSFTTMGLDQVAMEVLWWVSPEARKTRLSITLVKAFEFWAGKLGLTKLVLGSMQNSHSDAIDRFYTKQGYRFTERTYFKEIKNGSSN